VKAKRSQPLTEIQIADGINECMFSAAELSGGAHVLLGTKASPSLSLSLSFLALEEYGKVGLLFGTARLRATDVCEWETFWREFRLHDVKLQVALNTIELTNANKFFPGNETFLRNNPRPLNVAARDAQELKLKQMYTDFDEKLARFVSPRIRNHRGGEPEAEKMIKVLAFVGGIIAKNKAVYAFDPAILGLYRRVHADTITDAERKTLVGALYVEIFTRKPGVAREATYPLLRDEAAIILDEIRQAKEVLPYRPQPQGMYLHDDEYAKY